MQQLTQQQQLKSPTAKSDYIPKWIFVLQLHDGRYVVGQASNAARRIATINSGCNAAVKANSVNRIIGIKEQNEDRTFIGVVKSFCERKGENNVITV